MNLFQSHISENVEEVNEVLRQNPGCVNYAEVYDKCAILTNKVCMCKGINILFLADLQFNVCITICAQSLNC